jgi:hypothetical protein
MTMTMSLGQAAWLLLLASLPFQVAAVDLAEVKRSQDVWVVRFTDGSGSCEACSSSNNVWDELCTSLKRVRTGTVDVGEIEGKEMAKQMGLDVSTSQLPLLLGFTKGQESSTILKGAEAAEADLKGLRKQMKKALKGLQKNADGRFMKNPDDSDSSRFGPTDLMFLVQSQPAAEHEVIKILQ